MQSSIEYTRIEGAGEPIVLIHGIGHRREAWGRVPRLLADQGHDVYVVDLPGHGLSPAVVRPENYGMRSTAEQFERYFAGLGVERPHVLGNSLGGLIGLELAARGSVRSATVYSPAGFFPPHHLPNVGLNLLVMKIGSYLPESVHRRLNGNERLKALALRALYVHPEKVDLETAIGDTLNLRRAKGFWPHLARATFSRFTKDVQVPTTVAWGDTDRLLLPSEAQTARRRLPSATHVTLPGCGHCPQIDDPERVVEVAVATIARAAANGQGQAPTGAAST